MDIKEAREILEKGIAIGNFVTIDWVKTEIAIKTVLQELDKKDKLYQIALDDSVKTSKQIIEIKKILQENLRKDTIFEKGYIYGVNECQYITREIVKLLEGH